MAVTALMYGKAIANAFGGETAGESSKVDWLSDDIRVALVTSAYTPNQDTDEFWSDVVANEVVGTGYTANGAALANKTLTYTAGTNVNKFDADDVSWPASTITARYAVIYNRTPGSDATRNLISYVDFGANVSSTNGNFQITWDAAGIATITVA